MARQIKVEIVGDARGLQRAFSAAEHAGGSFARGVGRVAALAGAALGAVGLAGAIKSSVDAARESQRVGRQTEAVIKSTGGAARLSAKGFSDLANSISRKVGVDDEAIQSGENILATFTRVRNGVGKNNDIFNQATRAAVDLAAAMHHGEVTADGLQSANIQLGKALNNPLKGITALTRVGVTFDDQQKKQIKTLVESGRTMDAQRIILAELQKEFGGAAAAAATPWDRLKVALGNVQETIGGALLPVIDKAAEWIGARLPRAVEIGSGVWGHLSGAISPVVGWLRDRIPAAVRVAKDAWHGLTDAVGAVIAGFRSPQGIVLGDGVLSKLTSAGQTIRRVFDGMVEKLHLKEIADGLRDVAKAIGEIIVEVVTGDFGRVQATLQDTFGAETAGRINSTGKALAVVAGGLAGFTIANEAAGALAKVHGSLRALLASAVPNPIILLVGALVAGAVALALFGRKTEWGRNLLAKLGEMFSGVGQALRQFGAFLVTNVLPAVVSAGVAFGRALLPALKTLADVIVRQLWPALKPTAILIGAVLYVALAKVLPLLLRIAGPVLGFLISTLAKLIGWVANVINWAIKVEAAFLRWITGARTTGEAFRILGQNIATMARGAVQAFQAIGRVATIVFSGLKRAVAAAINFIITEFRGWFNIATTVVLGILRLFGKLPGPMGAPFRKAEEAVKKAKQTVNDQLDRIQRRVNRLTGKDIPVNVTGTVSWSKDAALLKRLTGNFTHKLPAFAQGGRLPGYGGGDRFPILAEGGEAVVPKDKVKRPEFQMWARMQGIPGFQHGGLLPGMRHMPALRDAAGRGLALAERNALQGASRLLAAPVFADAGPFGPASGNVVKLALAQAKRMAASFKVALALIEAGIVESGLRNLPYGDRDSLGFLQQRPSQGWLHPMNITYAAWDFLRRAIPIQGRYRTAGRLAQAVQRSAFPARYDAVQARALGILGAYGYQRGGLVMDAGGFLAPGWNPPIYNGTGRPEPVGAATSPITVNVVVNGVSTTNRRQLAKELAADIRNEIRDAQRRTGVPHERQLR